MSVAGVIAVACIVFMAAMLVIVVVEARREARKPPPVAHVESGSSHVRGDR